LGDLPPLPPAKRHHRIRLTEGQAKYMRQLYDFSDIL